MKIGLLFQRLRARVRGFQTSNGFWFVVYLVLLILIAPRELSVPEIVSFFAYALFLFWVLWLHARHERMGKASETSTRWFFLVLLVVGIALFVSTRALPFIRFGETPLGYDTGFYLQYMDEAFAAEKPTRQIIIYLWTPLLWLGFSPVIVLHGLYVLAQILTFGSFYALGRTLTSTYARASASVMVFLYAFSIVQFSSFWWMFYQTHFAVAFLVMTIALLYRRSPLALLTGAFGAVIHTPTFFVFGGALFLYALLRALVCRFRKLEVEMWIILALGLLAPITLLILRGPTYIADQWQYIAHYKFLATNFPEYQIQEALGLFIPPPVFKVASMVLSPMALLGVLFYLVPGKSALVSPEWKRRMTPIFIIFVMTLFLSSFPFVYQHRFFIYLSIALIIFSVHPIVVLVRYMGRVRVGQALLVVLGAGMVLYSAATTWHQRPQLYPEEAAEIRALNTDPRANGAVVMATHPLYTPWVGAFSERTVAAPGFYYNLFRIDQWAEIWSGPDDVRRHELLRLYRTPVYIFLGTWIEEGDLSDFLRHDPLVEQVSPHMFRYDTRSMTLEEIRAVLEGNAPELVE